MAKTAPPVAAFDLMRFTPYRLAVAAQALSEGLARHYRDQFGISIPDWRVLVHLAHSGGASVRDIEARVAMEKSKVSRAASRLQDRGLVAKREHDDDKRLVHLSLTAEGQTMIDQLMPIAAAFQAKIMARMGDDFAGFETGLERLLAGENDHIA